MDANCSVPFSADTEARTSSAVGAHRLGMISNGLPEGGKSGAARNLPEIGNAGM